MIRPYRNFVFLFVATISFAVGLQSALSQESQLETAVRIDTQKSDMQLLFGGMRFFPGTKITLRIDGAVIARRKVRLVEKCGGWDFFGDCLWGKKDVPETEFQHDRKVDGLPLLLAARDTDGVYMGGEASEPGAGPSPSVEGSSNPPLITISQPQTDILFTITSSNLEALDHGRALEAFLADFYDGAARTQRNVCTNYEPGECGAGQYSVSIVGVDTALRRERLKQMLLTDRIDGQQADRLIDFWTRNKLVGNKIVADRDSIRDIVSALMEQAEKHAGGNEATTRGGHRRALLELALRLEPENQKARGLLIEYLADSGDYGAAQVQAAANMNDARRAWIQAQETPNAHAGAYFDYARNLMAAAQAAAGRGAGMVLSDVQAAASLYREANEVLRGLRNRSDVQYEAGEIEAAESHLIRSLRRYAATSQLLRSDAALDEAIASLREARARIPKIETGFPFAVSGDLKHVLMAEGVNVVEAPPPSDKQLHRSLASLDIEFIPSEVRRVLAADDKEQVGIGVSSGKLIRWSNGGSTVKTTEGPNAGQLVSAVLVDGWLLAQNTTGKLSVLTPEGQLTVLKDTVLAGLGPDGLLARLGIDGKLRVGDSKNQEVYDIPQLASARPVRLHWGAAPSPETSGKVSILFSDLSLAEVVLNSDKTLKVLPAPLGSFGKLVDAVWTDSGTLIAITDTSFCLGRANEGIICRSHDMQSVGERITMPGLVPARQGEIVALVLRDQRPGTSSTLVIFDTTADLSKVTVGLRAAYALREIDMRVWPEWSSAYLAPASVESGELRFRLLTRTSRASLRSLRLEPGLAQEESWVESAFSGQAQLLNGGRQVFVVDQEGRKLRRPNVESSSADSLPGDLIDSVTGKTHVSLVRDKSSRILKVVQNDNGVQSVLYESLNGITGAQLIKMTRHDHGAAAAMIYLVDDKRVLTEISNISPSLVRSVVLENIAPESIYAVLRVGKDADDLVVLAEKNSRLAALSSKGIMRGPEDILSADEMQALKSQHAKLDVFEGTSRLILRLLNGVDSRIVSLKFDTGSKIMLYEGRVDFNEGSISSFEERNRGLGHPAPGFIDGTSGLALYPAGKCLKPVRFGMIANVEDLVLPPALPGSLLTVGQNEIALSGLPSGTRIYTGAPAATAIAVCP